MGNGWRLPFVCRCFSTGRRHRSVILNCLLIVSSERIAMRQLRKWSSVCLRRWRWDDVSFPYSAGEPEEHEKMQIILPEPSEWINASAPLVQSEYTMLTTHTHSAPCARWLRQWWNVGNHFWVWFRCIAFSSEEKKNPFFSLSPSPVWPVDDDVFWFHSLLFVLFFNILFAFGVIKTRSFVSSETDGPFNSVRIATVGTSHK